MSTMNWYCTIYKVAATFSASSSWPLGHPTGVISPPSTCDLKTTDKDNQFADWGPPVEPLEFQLGRIWTLAARFPGALPIFSLVSNPYRLSETNNLCQIHPTTSEVGWPSSILYKNWPQEPQEPLSSQFAGVQLGFQLASGHVLSQCG